MTCVAKDGSCGSEVFRPMKAFEWTHPSRASAAWPTRGRGDKRISGPDNRELAITYVWALRWIDEADAVGSTGGEEHLAERRTRVDTGQWARH